MGTHPIFESDFNCLTEIQRNSSIVRLRIGKYQNVALWPQNRAIVAKTTVLPFLNAMSVSMLPKSPLFHYADIYSVGAASISGSRRGRKSKNAQYVRQE